ncbi:ABC transporter substrate-binding protein [Deltaproteobacteria bacterium TL4]
MSSVEGTRSYQMELNNQSPPFKDRRIRQALNYTIDWDTILKEVYLGYAKRLATCFLPSGFGYAKELQPYPYNPQKAKKLLKDAGFQVTKD